jgi:3'-phosphoadenosine 5'-phosphosulfate (PAPS) 3'-phosphatase
MILADYRGEYRAELETALQAGQRAAAVILEFYDAQSAEAYIKGDGSPVTDADLASDRVIRETIMDAFPSDAMLTEEGASDVSRLDNPRCWIVDPIDGTAQYVARTGLFDVMIALCVHGRPVVAVSVQPVRNRIQAAVVGAGAWEIVDGVETRFRISPYTGSPRIVSHETPRLVTSKWYGGREEERGQAARRIASTMGAADPPVLEVGYQPRAFSSGERTYDAFIGLPQANKGSIAQEWDLACADLITHEAGGVLTDCWGRLHQYNKRSTNISGGILVSSSAGLHQSLLGAIAPVLPDQVPAPDPADDGVNSHHP